MTDLDTLPATGTLHLKLMLREAINETQVHMLGICLKVPLFGTHMFRIQYLTFAPPPPLNPKFEICKNKI